MTTIDATSEVFMTAFRALPKKAREAVLDKMLRDKEFREDLMDAAIIEQRRKEPSRPLGEYLSDRRKKANNAKKLHGREGMRVRVGNYRVLYVVDDADKRIEVISVADRKEVYR